MGKKQVFYWLVTDQATWDARVKGEKPLRKKDCVAVTSTGRMSGHFRDSGLYILFQNVVYKLREQDGPGSQLWLCDIIADFRL